MLSGNWDKLATMVEDQIYGQDSWQLSVVKGTPAFSPQGSDQRDGADGRGRDTKEPRASAGFLTSLGLFSSL